jgi:hypothetical protein
MRASRHRAARGGRRGIALLDVVVALTVLGLAGVALIVLLGQTTHSMRRVRDVERETRLASDELNQLVRLGRADLVAMTGRSTDRGWWIDVTRTGQNLFDVAISAADTTAPLLRTTLYRPDTNDALSQ